MFVTTSHSIKYKSLNRFTKAPYCPSSKAMSRNHQSISSQNVTLPAQSRLVILQWPEKATQCYVIEERGFCISRRKDNNMINGTKLLNLARISRGKRDTILKKVIERDVIRAGSLVWKGVWIPFGKAMELAKRFNIYDLIKAVFEENPEGSCSLLNWNEVTTRDFIDQRTDLFDEFETSSPHFSRKNSIQCTALGSLPTSSEVMMSTPLQEYASISPNLNLIPEPCFELPSYEFNYQANQMMNFQPFVDTSQHEPEIHFSMPVNSYFDPSQQFYYNNLQNEEMPYNTSMSVFSSCPITTHEIPYQAYHNIPFEQYSQQIMEPYFSYAPNYISSAYPAEEIIPFSSISSV